MYVPLVASPENENAPVASVVVVRGALEAGVSVTDADVMPFDVPACRTFPFRVNGAVCVVVVVVVVGAVPVDGVQPTIAAQRALTVITRANCEKSISTFYPSRANQCRGIVTLDIRE